MIPRYLDKSRKNSENSSERAISLRRTSFDVWLAAPFSRELLITETAAKIGLSSKVRARTRIAELSPTNVANLVNGGKLELFRSSISSKHNR